jgi:periplasmic protein TonB
MKSTKKKNYSIITAVCISLLIHVAVGALLIFGLSNNSITPPKLNGVNLVWISLDAGNKSSKVEIQNNRKEQPLTAKTIIVKPANVENPARVQEIAPAYAMATKQSINIISPAKHEASGNEARELSDNISGYRSANNAADRTSLSNTVIAYPLYKENAPPVYPEVARARGYEGIVLVSAEILPDGRVGEIKIRKSSGYAILDQSAVQAVKPWRFEPAKKSGNPFTAWVELPIKFILHSDRSQS